MKIVLLAVGNIKEQYLIEGISHYNNRLAYYTKFEIVEIPNIKKSKGLSKIELIREEGIRILKYLNNYDYVVLLDETGKDFTSFKFAKKLQQWLLVRKKRLVFVIGGAYGSSDLVNSRADEKLSLSRMTFSHQMVRLFFVEQIYRGLTILNNEPYHHN